MATPAGDSDPTGASGATSASGATTATDPQDAARAAFDVTMLPARHGDCLWLEYGPAARPFRSLVDCGTKSAWPALKARIEALPPEARRFELLVVSHVDDDHIGGALALLQEARALGVSFGDVWFNAYPHLEGKRVASGPDLLGAKQGEALSSLIVDGGFAWNRAFGGAAVVCPDAGDPPTVTLPSGLALTLLSPYREQLDAMRKAWIAECRKAGLLPGGGIQDAVVDDLLGDETDVDALARSRFEPDTAPANGSSIALLARFGGRAALLGADAHAPVLERSLERLGWTSERRLALAAFKLAHHGSDGNTSRTLVERLAARRVLVSTNGDKFRHPDRVALARVVAFNAPGATLCFNYATEFNAFWRAPARQAKHRFEAVYPAAGEDGLRVRL